MILPKTLNFNKTTGKANVIRKIVGVSGKPIICLHCSSLVTIKCCRNCYIPRITEFDNQASKILGAVIINR
jgi:hypothetical protein